MAARAHMEKHGTTSEDFGRIAVLSRTNALDNDRAMMRKPMTLEDHQASRWIAEPFHMFDCCLETDGAVAIVLVRADRAADLPHRPVLVQGAAWGGGITVVNNGHTDLTRSPAEPIAERVYAAAGLGPSDIELRRALRLLHLQRPVPDRGLRLRRARGRCPRCSRRGRSTGRPGRCRSTPTAACSRRATSTA